MEKPTLDKFPRRVLAQIDIQTAFIVSRLVVACERLEVFRRLHGKSMTAQALGRRLKIHEVYLQPFLNTLLSLGLLRRTGDRYANTAFAEKYFVRERSVYWTRQYSAECLDHYEALTGLEQALVSGKRKRGTDYVDRMRKDRRYAAEFTSMLYHLHQPDAAALADYLDLSRHAAVLDVGGGSGVMSIALLKKNPHLRASILDIAPVCRIAARYARKAGVGPRVRTLAGDLRRPLPRGYDVILLCDIGKLPPGLLERAYESLPDNGLVVLADPYLIRGGTQPLDRVAVYFGDPGFGLATRDEMVRAVKASGFGSVKARNIYQDVWFITGTK